MLLSSADLINQASISDNKPSKLHTYFNTSSTHSRGSIHNHAMHRGVYETIHLLTSSNLTSLHIS